MNNKNRVLKISALLGLLGPLPGFTVYAGRNFFVSSELAESLRLFAYFYAGAVLLFGWYCFIIGFAAALLHGKLDAAGWSRPARTSVIVGLGVMAAIPTILIEGTVSRGLGLAGAVSAGFWIGAYLLMTFRAARPARMDNHEGHDRSPKA